MAVTWLKLDDLKGPFQSKIFCEIDEATFGLPACSVCWGIGQIPWVHTPHWQMGVVLLCVFPCCLLPFTHQKGRTPQGPMDTLRWESLLALPPSLCSSCMQAAPGASQRGCTISPQTGCNACRVTANSDKTGVDCCFHSEASQYPFLCFFYASVFRADSFGSKGVFF